MSDRRRYLWVETFLAKPDAESAEAEPLSALRMNLVKGLVSSSGVYRDEGDQRVRFSKLDWQYFEFAFGTDVRLPFLRDERRPPASNIIIKVRFDRAFVMGAFPAPRSSPPKSTSGMATRAQEGLRSLAQAHSENRAPIPIKAVWCRECGLSQREAARVWRIVATEFPDLHKPGRRPNKQVG